MNKATMTLLSLSALWLSGCEIQATIGELDDEEVYYGAPDATPDGSFRHDSALPTSPDAGTGFPPPSIPDAGIAFPPPSIPDAGLADPPPHFIDAGLDDPPLPQPVDGGPHAPPPPQP